MQIVLVTLSGIYLDQRLEEPWHESSTIGKHFRLKHSYVTNDLEYYHP